MARHDDEYWMKRAIDLALRGQGHVEPNPMVGCIIVRNGEALSQGWHESFGGPHAEVNALESLPVKNLSQTTVFVTLEPCCHFGKTPPCVDELCRWKPERVVIGVQDPNPQVSGRSLARLRDAGVEVEVGVLERECQALIAPFAKRMTHGKPWVIAKWAMTLDGRIACADGDSRWISNESSRRIVHQLRGRMDAICVGIETVLRDDPLLNARPPGPRNAIRVLLDSNARLPLDSALVKTARQYPVLVVCHSHARPERIQPLRDQGCEVAVYEARDRLVTIDVLLRDLSSRGVTNLMVEGGTTVLGSFFDAGQIDEAHVFIAPKLIGGSHSRAPIGGTGIEAMSLAKLLTDGTWQQLESDMYFCGRTK